MLLKGKQKQQAECDRIQVIVHEIDVAKCASDYVGVILFHVTK